MYMYIYIYIYIIILYMYSYIYIYISLSLYIAWKTVIRLPPTCKRTSPSEPLPRNRHWVPLEIRSGFQKGSSMVCCFAWRKPSHRRGTAFRSESGGTRSYTRCIYIYTHIQVYIIYMYVYMYICVCIYTYAYTYTHT